MKRAARLRAEWTGVWAWLGVVFLMPFSVLAQYYDSPGLDSQPVVAHPQDYKPLGIRAGSFMLHPGVQLAIQHTDNVFFDSDEERSDTVFHVRPYITAQSTWSRHSLALTASADIARYDDFGSRDYEDYFLGLNGRVDVLSRSFFTYGADFLDLHEDLNNRGSEQGVEPTRYNTYGGNVGYDHTFNRLSLGARYTYQKADYDDVFSDEGSIIDNQDRDRDTNSWLLRAGYQFQTDRQAFVSYTGYTTSFDQSSDRNGFDRGGDGYTLSGGLALSITGKLNGNVFASYQNRSFDDPALPDVNGWSAGAGLVWSATEMTSVYADIASSVEDTTNRFSSGILQRIYSLRVDHELTRFIQVNLFGSYRDGDYQVIDGAPVDARAKDEVYRYGVGASWFINRHLFLNGSYAYEKLNTNVPNDDYNVNNFWLALGLEY